MYLIRRLKIDQKNIYTSFDCLRLFVVVYKLVILILIIKGCICVQGFITLCIGINLLAQFIGLYHNVWPWATLFTNKLNDLARLVIDSNLYAKFHLHILPGFC